MKKIFVLLLITFSFSAFAGEITYFSGTWNETLKKAKAENKYVLLDCYTDWCSWCKVMDKSTLKSDTTLEVLNKSFVCCRREMEKDPEGLQLCMKYLVNGFPTYLVFNGDGKLVYAIIGYRPTVDFVAELKKSIDPATQVSYPGFSAAMDPGYPQFYKNAFGVRGVRRAPGGDTVNVFLDAQKDPKSEVSWAVMQHFHVNLKYEKWILENADALRKLYGTGIVDDKVSSIIYEEADSAASRNSEVLLQKAISDLDKYFPGMDHSYSVRQWRVNFYAKNKNWMMIVKTYTAVMDTSKGDALNNISYEMNNVAWNFYTTCDDKKANEGLLPLIKKAAENQNNYATWDTYASLLYKAEHYADAKAAAEKAIAMGKAANETTTSTEDLLKQIDGKLK